MLNEKTVPAPNKDDQSFTYQLVDMISVVESLHSHVTALATGIGVLDPGELPDSPETAPTAPNLLTALQTTPATIREQVEETHKLLTEIENKLRLYS